MVGLGVRTPEFEPSHGSDETSKAQPLWQHIFFEFFSRLNNVHIALTVKTLHQGAQLFISRVYRASSLALEERGLDANFCPLTVDIDQLDADEDFQDALNQCNAPCSFQLRECSLVSVPSVV